MAAVAFISMQQSKLKLCNAFNSKEKLKLRNHEKGNMLPTVNMTVLEQLLFFGEVIKLH